MDFGGCSDGTMSGQTNNAMSSDLDKCVKVAEMSFLKLDNDLFQPDSTPYYKRVKTQDQIAKEGFPKFRDLPAELRLKVWENSMPPYGIFTALMFGREEPKPQQPPPPAPMAFRLVYRLEPVPRDQQDDELRIHLDTMRAIQRTSSEAASEVQRAFPTTINCTGGKLRFNADHDTLSLSDRKCKFARNICSRFTRYSQGTLAFADEWHKIPRNMVYNSRPLWNLLGWPQYPPTSQYAEGFMEFLADCTRLKSFGFMYDKALHDDLMTRWIMEQFEAQFLRFCHPAPVMKGLFYGEDRPPVSIADGGSWVTGLEKLESLIHGQSSDQELPSHGIRLGRPELQHLHLHAMFPADPAVFEMMKGARQE